MNNEGSEINTVEPLIAASYCQGQVAAILRFTTNMGKRLGLKVSGRYREVAALGGSTVYK